jgi:hypothetical protein
LLDTSSVRPYDAAHHAHKCGYCVAVASRRSRQPVLADGSVPGVRRLTIHATDISAASARARRATGVQVQVTPACWPWGSPRPTWMRCAAVQDVSFD